MNKREVMKNQLERKLAYLKSHRPEGLETPVAKTDHTGLVHEVNEQTAASLGFTFYRVDVPDIQTLKTLVGTPDELIEEGLLQDITAEPEMMSREREMELLHADRNAFLGETCQAFRSYIYGYSPKAKSYEKVINALRFPTSVETYEIPELYIKRGEVYEFGKDDPEKHMAVVIDKLTMEEDARIISYCYADITVNQGQTKNDSVIGNCGTNGTDGTTPEGTGAAGTTGTKGSASKDGKHSCDVKAGKGGMGGTGLPGKSGGNGGNGGNGSTLTCTFSKVEGVFPKVCCSGGAGGKGGNGTQGGTGGAGGPGGDASGHCGAGKQGDGGTGGVGGRGGDGGDGGNGGDVILTVFLEEGQKAFDIKIEAKGGTGGRGGKGGDGGDGGAGCVGGTAGAPGTSGDSGNSGDAGKINITQI